MSTVSPESFHSPYRQLRGQQFRYDPRPAADGRALTDVRIRHCGEGRRHADLRRWACDLARRTIFGIRPVRSRLSHRIVHTSPCELQEHHQISCWLSRSRARSASLRLIMQVSCRVSRTDPGDICDRTSARPRHHGRLASRIINIPVTSLVSSYAGFYEHALA